MNNFIPSLNKLPATIGSFHIIIDWRSVSFIIFKIILSVIVLTECVEKLESYLNFNDGVVSNVPLDEIILSFHQIFTRYNCLKEIYKRLFLRSGTQNDQCFFNGIGISLNIQFRWIFYIDVVRFGFCYFHTKFNEI